MLVTILIGVVVVIAVLMLVAASKPTLYRVERSAAMAAAPETVFAEINDLHKWSGWSPWEKMDPAMAKTFDGPPAGVGAAYSWDSKSSQVGAGTITIVESRPSELATMRLDFKKPLANTCMATFALTPDAGKTVVTWSMDGKKLFIMKFMSLFMDVDAMVAKQFDEGLANLKAIAEAK